MKTLVFFHLIFLICCSAAAQSGTRTVHDTTQQQYSMEACVNQFNMSKTETTAVGYQYWFVDRNFLDGRTVKMSVVAPHSATHPPHSHPEDEVFFVLEGKAEFFLNGKTQTAGPLTSFYCPSNSKHGIRNVGDTVLKYLVIKKYKQQ
jgi:quercetin dioxygenase-like cupin family protein